MRPARERLLDWALREVCRDNPALRCRLRKGRIDVREAQRILMLSTAHQRDAVVGYLWRMERAAQQLQYEARDLRRQIDDVRASMANMRDLVHASSLPRPAPPVEAAP